MKQYVTYTCEKCNRESRNANEIIKCEAAHLGLTTDESFRYNGLKEVVKRCSHMVSITKNEKTDKEFDDAIKEIIAFEKVHGIIR